MHQTDRGEYRTKESAFKQFRHTCLGKIVIALGIFVLLLVLAWITNPSHKRMQEKMEDNIKESIWSRDSITADDMDIFVSCIGHTFTSFTDSVTDDMRNRWNLFIMYNDTAFYDHTFFSTMYVFNKLRSEHERCGVGIFGMVIPTADFNRFIPRDGERKEYNKPLIQQNVEEDPYFGETHVDVFHWEGGE
jgi:hypothetical protein